MKLVGANSKAVASGLEKQPGIVNYFIGNDPKKWRTRVPTYARAKLAGIYPGIDVVYYGVEARGKRQQASVSPSLSPAPSGGRGSGGGGVAETQRSAVAPPNSPFPMAETPPSPLPHRR